MHCESVSVQNLFTGRVWLSCSWKLKKIRWLIGSAGHEHQAAGNRIQRRAEVHYTYISRVQCFSQPASLITYRRRQRSNVENIKAVQNELENLHMILLCKKGSHGVCVRGKQRSIPLPNCLESWTLKNHVQFICNSHTTTMCAHPEKRPRTIGSWWEPSLNCRLHSLDMLKNLVYTRLHA